MLVAETALGRLGMQRDDLGCIWLGTVLEQLASPINREEEQAWVNSVMADYPTGCVHMHPKAVTSKYSGLAR
jgi:hypothetical protein